MPFPKSYRREYPYHSQCRTSTAGTDEESGTTRYAQMVHTYRANTVGFSIRLQVKSIEVQVERMDGKLDTPEKKSSINLLIAREYPNISKIRKIREDSTRNLAIQCLSNVTASTRSEVVQTCHRRYTRRNLRKGEPCVKKDCCILGLCACNLSLDLNWLAIRPDDTVNIE